MNKTIEAVLKLSAKLGNVAAFNQLGAKMAAVNKQAAAYNRTQRSIAKATSAAYLATARLIAPAAVAYGAASAVKSYARIERQIGRIGITAEASAAETREAMASLQAAAARYAMPFDEATAGLETLVASGKSLKEAMAFLPSVLATAQATGAEVAAVASTADAMTTSLGIGADRMTAAFDILAKAGKDGKFEMRDMAAEFSALAPAFAALGYRGEEGLKKLAAAAQTVRAQTGSSAEAATNLMSVFQKMETDETVNRFRKFGIDLRRELSTARAEGRDLLKTFVSLSEQAMKGDMSKIPQLFGDQEMQKGMRALLMGADSMERLVVALGNADGTVMKDLGRVLGDTQAKVERLTGSFDRLWTSVGAALTDLGAADTMDKMTEGIARAEATKKGLEARGVKGELAQAWWQMNASESERNAVIWEGRYRSAADLANRDAYAAHAAGRGTAPAMPIGSVAMPTPRPGDRPGRRIRGGKGHGEGQVQIRMGSDAPSMTRDQAATARAQVMDAGGWANEADKVTQALASGGDKAGQAVKGAAETGGQSMATAILSAGRTVAAEIGAAIAAGASKVKAANQPIRANTGRSGPEFEGVP